jgi:hypothetical protein
MILSTRAAGSTVPVWAHLVANWFANLPLVLVVAGLLILVLPFYKPAWVIEIGLWVGASGAILVSLGLVAVTAVRSPLLGLLVAHRRRDARAVSVPSRYVLSQRGGRRLDREASHRGQVEAPPRRVAGSHPA